MFTFFLMPPDGTVCEYSSGNSLAARPQDSLKSQSGFFRTVRRHDQTTAWLQGNQKLSDSTSSV